MVQKYDPLSANQSVWLIENDSTKIEKIKMSIAPEVKSFKDIDILAEQIDFRFNMSDESYATLIVDDDNIPSDIRQLFNTFVDGINIFKKSLKERLIIFEINSKGENVFVDSILCADIDDFLMKSQNVRIDKLTNDVNVSEEAKKLIDTLKIDNEKKKRLIEKSQDEITQLKKDNKELSEKNELIKNQIETYKMNAEKAKENEELSNENYKKIEEDNKSKKALIDQNNREIEELKMKVSDLDTQNKAKEEIIRNLNLNISNLMQQKNDIEDEYQDLLSKHEAIYNAKNEIEENEILNENIRSLEEQKKKLKREIEEVKQEKIILEYKIKDLENEIQELRNGFKNTNRIGYSNLFGTIHLQRTNVLYIKVIQDFPNLKLYLDYILNMLKEIIRENKNDYSNKIKIVYHKVDFGQDKILFPNCDYIGNLGSVGENDKYRIMPSLNIDEDSEKFEQEPHLLIFVDYISDDKYYVETDKRIDYLNLVNDKKQMSELNLKGYKVSNERDSFLNMQLPDNFNGFTEENKRYEMYSILSDIVVLPSIEEFISPYV